MKDNNFNSNLYSILESSCKQIESLSNKNKSSFQSNPKPATYPSNLADPSQKPRPRFTVQSTPKEKFALFEKNDFYHYERKFHNKLPDVIIPPISFHLAHSNENFCNFDMKTMMFGLKGTGEILTNPRLNTEIHKDFIENSMNLIFPDGIKSKEIEVLEKSASRIIKDEILKIIDAKEETEEKEHKILSAKSNASYYLRASTLLSSTLSLKKKNSGTLAVQGSNNINQSQEAEEKANILNLKKTIENSFRKIKKIEEGVQHPHKKNVYAKSVYNIQPFHQFDGEDFCQILFPTDPVKELETSGVAFINEDFAKPDKFLLRKEDNEEVYEFYKQEKLANNEEDNMTTITHEINKAELYSFEREYTVNLSNPCEVFNRYLIFLDNSEKSAKFVPIDHKLFLKKYKKVINVPVSDMDEYGSYSQLNNINQSNLNKKRERAIILSAIEENMNTINRKNENFRDKGVQKEFKRIKLDNPDYTDIDLIKEKKMSKYTEEENINQVYEDKSHEEEDDDLFGVSDVEDRKYSSDNEDDLEQEQE